MKNSARTVQIPLLLFLILCLHPAAFGQQAGKWRVRNRLQTSYEFDNNIRENPSDSLGRINDSSLRFIFHSQATRTNPKSRLTFSYQGGLQSYVRNSIENKLINEVQFSANHKLGRMLLGVRGRGRLKIYLNDILDYSTGAIELFFRPPNIFRFGNEVALKASAIAYQNFPAFDYSVNELRWSVSRKLSSRLIGAFTLSGRQVTYDRSALSFNPVDSLRVNNFDQKDRLLNAQWQLNYTKSFLVNFKYSFQYNNSNSFGYSFVKHQFILILGFPVASSVWLRGYTAFQSKNYSEKAIPIFPTDVDTEREESNFFVIDLSRDFKPNLTALVRLAYYNNESIIRSQFYRKLLLTAGFDFRF
ncbi:MAG: hypothetical protein ACE5G1_10190 [bacterium]